MSENITSKLEHCKSRTESYSFIYDEIELIDEGHMSERDFAVRLYTVSGRLIVSAVHGGVKSSYGTTFFLFFIQFCIMESTPVTSKKQSDLTRDQRLQVITLRDVEWRYAQIAEHLNLTIHQVQYACIVARPTSQKHRSGRRELIDEDARRMLVNFVCASSENRRIAA